jgi:methylenetetrahydrofolate--tRNA-(uracil-5-)-methyltransferase
MELELDIIGGGLAGCEAAWQAAIRGIKVKLYEMRPTKTTGAHQTGDLAELVCSNSLGTRQKDRATGILLEELKKLGSKLVECAENSALPAGSALAVDRQRFSQIVESSLLDHPNIKIIRKEITSVPESPAIIASGPLTSEPLANSISILTGKSSLYFYDAIAPIVTLDSINMNLAFRASRFGHSQQEEGDYINCPLSIEEYSLFIDSLLSAQRVELKNFESAILHGVTAGAPRFFEGCLPIEVLAARGRDALAYGPMRPVGLHDPRTGDRPYAIVQFRQDNLAGDLYNMVGFQTNLHFGEQQRVFRLIPGLENAEFIRFGQMHRNTFLASPVLLQPTLQFKERPNLFFAGQLIGAEGYLGNIATGLVAGINASLLLNGQLPLTFPGTSMIGALLHYITHVDLKDFQPMKANMGILPPFEKMVKAKRDRSAAYSMRCLNSIDTFKTQNPETFPSQ